MESEIDVINALEAEESAAQLRSEVTALENFNASIASLESIVSFFDSTESVSLEELALADIVIDSALKGTDVTPEQAMPALESYVGKQVSTESLKDTLIKYYQQIVEFLKRIYKSAVEFYVRHFDEVERLSEQFSKLLILLDANKSSQAIEPEVLVGPTIKKLAVAYKLPKTADEIIVPLGVLRSVCRDIFQIHAKSMHDLSARIVSSKVPTDGSLEALARVNELVGSAMESMLRTFREKADSQPYTLRTAILFNNRAVFTNAKETGYDGNQIQLEGELKVASDLRSIVFKVDTTEDPSIVPNYGSTSKEKAGAFTMPAMNADKLAMICANVMEIIKVIKEYRKHYQESLLRQANESERQAKQFAAALSGRGALSVDGSERVDSVPALKAIIGYHGAIAKWSVEPFAGLMQYCTTTFKSLHSVLVQHVANLEGV